jgi:CBS domain-containing protein
MQVKELMTPAPLSCHVSTDIATVARLMWKADCGVIPVTDDGIVTGIITDRDICIAIAAKEQLPRHILAGAIAVRKVVTCLADDTVLDALAVMKEHRVRRLPVVDAAGCLIGMLSWSDALLAAHGRPKVIPLPALVSTYEAICTRRRAKSEAAAPAGS